MLYFHPHVADTGWSGCLTSLNHENSGHHIGNFVKLKRTSFFVKLTFSSQLVLYKLVAKKMRHDQMIPQKLLDTLFWKYIKPNKQGLHSSFLRQNINCDWTTQHCRAVLLIAMVELEQIITSERHTSTWPKPYVDSDFYWEESSIRARGYEGVVVVLAVAAVILSF